jgi:hypothetical protein
VGKAPPRPGRIVVTLRRLRLMYRAFLSQETTTLPLEMSNQARRLTRPQSAAEDKRWSEWTSNDARDAPSLVATAKADGLAARKLVPEGR